MVTQQQIVDIVQLRKKIHFSITWQSYASWLIGLGSIFFIWHNINQPLINIFFIPQVGMAMMFAGLCICLVKTEWREFFRIRDWKIDIPILVIFLSIVLSSIGHDAVKTNSQWWSIVAVGIMLVGLYYCARELGNRIWKPYAIAVVIESISIVWYGAVHNWIPNGGLLSNTNYDIAIGLLIFGLLVAAEKNQWWLAGFVVVGIYFSGAAEGLFAIIALGIIWTIKNWKVVKRIPVKNLIITGGIGAAVVIGMIPVTWSNIWTSKLVDRIIDAINGNWYVASGYRMSAAGNWNLTMPIRPFGYGFNFNNFYVGIPHNLGLIIIEQVGIVAFIAFVLLAIYMIRKMSWHWKWVWIGMILLGVFDHFIWTEAAPWWWLVAGICSAVLINKEKELDNNRINYQTVSI